MNNYVFKTNKELKQICKERGLKRYSKLRKLELQELLLESDSKIRKKYITKLLTNKVLEKGISKMIFEYSENDYIRKDLIQVRWRYSRSWTWIERKYYNNKDFDSFI